MNFTRNHELFFQALRSGEYKQGRERLAIFPEEIVQKQEDIRESPDDFDEEQRIEIQRLDPTQEYYCCMGVACELGIKQGIIKEYDQTDGYPPDKINEAFGFLDTQYSCSKDDDKRGTDRLAWLNDSKHFTFEQIEEEMRAHPELYFVNND